MLGKTLNHYEIGEQLGAGGMGAVYRAKDQILGRDVAIKVLPEEFAKDADRVARFQREAKLLASLNHPNIAAIHGLETSDQTNFLVLELVEGQTLGDRIKQGPIPVEESLKLALQVAEALEAAHEKGVIHRDLKPSNIKVTPDGKVKVLDFGLAKAYAGEQAELNLSNSPTLSNAATQQGVILGTAAYMSPEQARGKNIDKRADIWAFGCLLYEMLTGQAAFQGEDVTEILAAVVKGGTNLDLLPPNLHPRVREAITRCLQKDLRSRYPDIADARYEIEQILAAPGGVFVQPVTTAEARSNRRILPWIAVAVLLTAITAGIAVWKMKPAESRQVMRFEYELPEGQQFSDLSFGALAVSPDGRQFVYSTTKGLYLRSIDELTAKLIPGTEDSVQQPFFSPDGKWIGYFSAADGQLKKISISGGAPMPLCAVAQLLGACWTAGNTIVYGHPSGGIMRISASGGTPVSLVKVKSGNLLMSPQILPDGKSMLYYRGSGPTRMIMVQSLESGEPKELLAAQYARYLPTGHIYYWIMGNPGLFAVPFDLGRLAMTGDPVPVAGAERGVFSDSGTLVYIPGRLGAVPGDQRNLVWVDRKGKEEPLGAPVNLYRFPAISPDGTKVAMTVVHGGQQGEIWIYDLVRGTLTRLTFERSSISPVWTPDGKRIAFFSGTALDKMGIYWKAADGTGKDEPLGSLSGQVFYPYCLSSDGKTLVGVEKQGFVADGNIEMKSVEGDHPRKPLLQESYEEDQPKISPDGRWMAYTSNESRKNEVYVRSFPDVNKGQWQVSTNGGDSPLWSPDGRELFYRSDDAVMAVSVKSEQSFSILGTPQVLFRGTYVGRSQREGTPWDIHPDGKRFLMLKQAVPTASESGAAAPRPKINIVINWFEELKQQVPVK